RAASNLSLGEHSRLGSMDVDAVLGYTNTSEEEPRTLETGFVSDETYAVSYDLSANPFAPVYALTNEADPSDVVRAVDPTHYRLSYFSITRTDVEEREASAKLDFKVNLGGGADYLKFGAKALRRRRVADTDRELFDAATSRDMTGLVGSSLVRLDTVGYR